MPRFDFISGEEFRNSLESDYRELLIAIEHGAWKTVHVLAGSIIEAVLVDYLVAIGYQARSRKDPLSMVLAELIAVCKTEGILSQRSADLSSVVKDYRNLIHPGRTVRLQEVIDEDGARVASALVEIILKDVERTKKQTYGPTAEQVVDKLEQDSSVVGVIEYVLIEVSEFELERLLVSVLPRTYFEHSATAADHPDDEERDKAAATLPILATCFRRAFDLASEPVKRKATKNFVRIIKEGTKRNVLAYEAELFQSADLMYVEQGDSQLVKLHLLERLKSDKDMALGTFLRLIDGIGGYLDESDASAFADVVMQMLARNVYDGNKQSFISQISAEHQRMPSNARSIVERRIQVWADWFDTRHKPDDAEIARELHNVLTFDPDDVPF